MKAEFKYLLSFLFVAVMLVSCGKITPTGNNNNEDGTEQGGNGSDPGTIPNTPVREISVSFGTRSTRTHLDENNNLKPIFDVNDVILVAQKEGGVEPKPETIIQLANGDLGFRTELTGDLVAVYPAERAVKSGNYIIGVEVLPKQSGLFKDANICMAEIADGAKTATFKNQTAMLVVNAPEGTDQLTVSSLGKIDSTTGQRGNSSSYITSAGGTTIVVPGNNAACPATCYVAVMADDDDPALLTDLCVDTGEYMGGFSSDLLSAKNLALNYPVKAGEMYHFDYFHPYVEIGGMKWSTMNIGADSPEEYGEYFAWGATKGYKATEDFPSWGFLDAECDFSPGNYSSPEYYNNILKLKNDAAYYNWGGAWRMPTSDELNALLVYYSQPIENGDVGSGYKFTEAGIELFFPAAGRGEGNNVFFNGEEDMASYHWSSTKSETNPYCLRCEEIWDTDDPDYPYTPDDFEYYDTYLFHSISNFIVRSNGMPVRPIYVGGSSEPDEPDDDGGLTIEPYDPINMSTNISL